MGLSRSRTFYLITLLSLVVFSLRREPRVDGFVDALFAPAHVLGVLAAPVRWLSAREVRAAAAELDAQAGAEMAASRALLAAEQSSARPTQASLLADRGFVLAEVMSDVGKRHDEVEIAYNPAAFLAPGMPVVCGDFYVGRVQSLSADIPGQARVALVTGANFRVGAIVETQGEDGKPRRAELVVGGLVNRRIAGGEGLHLAAHFSRDRSIDRGVVRVFESDALEAEPYRKLANGYGLGDLKPNLAQDVKQSSVEAKLQYSGGLTEVAVLCPEAPIDGGLRVRDPFDDAAWIEADLVVDGNPSPWRAGSKVSAGSKQGLVENAALAVGPRYLGRLTNVGRWAADARLLGDPGFQVNVLARIDGREAPLALGRLTSLGFDREGGLLLLRAEGRLPRPRMDDGRAHAATLFTGSGDPGVPAGLWIGQAELPADARAEELRVNAPQTRSALSRVSIWRAPAAALTGGSRP